MVETFPIIPADSRATWPLVLIFGVLALVLILFVMSARGARTSRFEVSPEGLRIRGDLYGRMIPASAIDAASVRVVDLGASPELVPRLRTMGTALAGYQSGWFRLRNREKALLYLTDRRHAVYARTTKGYSVLLSPQQPDRFAERLRAIAR